MPPPLSLQMSPQVHVRDQPGGGAVHPAGQQRQAGGGPAGGQQQRGAVEEAAGRVPGGDGPPQRPGEVCAPPSSISFK